MGDHLDKIPCAVLGSQAGVVDMGVSRASLDWFKSYLSGRLQCVRIGAETSSLQGISHGVPQGSILGPALFTIYLSNIPSIPDVCSLESYVDDSKLYLSFPVAEASNVIQQINKDLKKSQAGAVTTAFS